MEDANATTREAEPATGAATPDAAPERRPLDRLASFRFAYLAIFAFILAYVFTVEGLERALSDYFLDATIAATSVDPANGPVPDQIHAGIQREITESAWVRIGDVRVRPLVLAADGRTAIYAAAPIPGLLTDPDDLGERLLPAMIDVEVSVPHNALAANAILVLYAALLVTTLAIHTRRLTSREAQDLQALAESRDSLSSRARGIEEELGIVRERLAEIEPEHTLFAEEVDSLASERQQLLAQLDAVEQRERELRALTAGSEDLDAERRALEELLDEATNDLADKESQIEELRSEVRRNARGKGKPARENELIERRLRTLYKNLEVDTHAIDNLVALRDESLKLRAEEAFKRLSDEPDQAVVRRKVGGLPPHLSIFELGFAGKGRIYYTKGQARRFRVLLVGAKNSQKTDLEYLSRLPKES